MCGVTGYLSKQGPVTEDFTIRQMADLQRHRGPDDSGFVAVDSKRLQAWELPAHNGGQLSQPADLMIGFNRLSILDLSPNGHQPMLGADGRVILMMNGEVYNAFAFSDSLKQKGYQFRGKSDTEVVLNLYLEYGLDGMLERLNGMFAIVICDLRHGKVFLARDRFGIKPLYIYEDQKYFAFSSEIKSFLALPGLQFRLDESLLSEFLLFRGNREETLIKGVSNLEPGCCITYDLTGQCQNRRLFATMGTQTHLSDRPLEQVLREATTHQLLADVTVGCQLSGGVDSSLVTFFAAEAMREGDLETISITFDNQRFSEQAYVEQVHRRIGLRSHCFEMSPAYYFSEIQRATWHLEQPLNHPNTIGILLLSQHAREFVTVLLSGEGADELFGGYSRFTDLQRPFGRYLLSKLRHENGSRLALLRQYSDEAWRTVMATAYGAPSLTASVYPAFSAAEAVRRRVQLYRGLAGDRFTKQRVYEVMTYLPDLLMRQDKMSMAHSIENRVPFLDNDVADCALSMHSADLLKRVDGRWQGKNPLKEMAAAIFGHSFAYRRKRGFAVPLREFMQHEAFRELWNAQIAPGIRGRGLFRLKPMENIISRLDTASTRDLELLWNMLSFELWASQYLDGNRFSGSLSDIA